MATLLGGIGSSHARSIEVATDKRLFEDPVWKPLFDGYRPAKEWLKRVRPDVVIAVYNDHGNHFFFDNYPTFALGVARALAASSPNGTSIFSSASRPSRNRSRARRTPS